MRKRLFVLLLTAAVLSGASAAIGAGQLDQASTDTGQTAPPPSTTLRVRGTIDRYEASTGLLSLSTLNGIVQFPIASSARIRQRREKIEAAALEKLVGYRVAIHYTEVRGSKTVESIQVFAKSERTTR